MFDYKLENNVPIFLYSLENNENTLFERHRRLDECNKGHGGQMEGNGWPLNLCCGVCRRHSNSFPMKKGDTEEIFLVISG